MTKKDNVENNILTVAILGAGGIGCYYGARLEAQGHKIVYIARGEHLLALKSKGLTLKHPEFSYQEKVTATDLENLFSYYTPSSFDVIIVCVKATATEALAISLKSWFAQTKQETMILSLQNGIDNEPQLAKALGEKLIIGGLAVRIGGHIVSPGVVEATGIAQVVLGVWPNAKADSEHYYVKSIDNLVDVFNKANIPTRLVENIRYELWKKLIINNGVNPLSALTHLDTRSLSHHTEFGPLVKQMMQETALVSSADGEKLNEQDVEEMYSLIRDFDPIKTSMLVDLEKGRPLELEAISGAIIRRAKKMNVQVPVTETVYALLKFSLKCRDAE
jgi:2-dehydropantoate 2-reductase